VLTRAHEMGHELRNFDLTLSQCWLALMKWDMSCESCRELKLFLDDRFWTYLLTSRHEWDMGLCMYSSSESDCVRRTTNRVLLKFGRLLSLIFYVRFLGISGGEPWVKFWTFFSLIFYLGQCFLWQMIRATHFKSSTTDPPTW